MGAQPAEGENSISGARGSSRGLQDAQESVRRRSEGGQVGCEPKVNVQSKDCSTCNGFGAGQICHGRNPRVAVVKGWNSGMLGSWNDTKTHVRWTM